MWNYMERMDNTIERHTNLGYKFLYAAVGRRGNLRLHEILNEFFHVHIFNQYNTR